MKDDQPLGVAIVGDRHRGAHVAAIHQSAHLRLRATAPAASLPGDMQADPVRLADVPIQHDPQNLLADDGIQVIVVCGPPAERSYWMLAGTQAGKQVVSPLPPQWPSSASDVERWRPDIPLAWSGARHEVTSRCQHVRDLSYVRATMSVPAKWLCGEGVLQRWGAWLPWLLHQAVGPIDIIQARARSYHHGAPAEDQIIALLSFTNGVEGHLEVEALGNHARWQVDLIGADGPIQCGGDLQRDLTDGYRALYASFNEEESAPRAAEAQEALYLCHWLRQSARLGTSLTRREARQA